MARAFHLAQLPALGLALSLSLGLGGCTPGFVIDHLPDAVGGEPAGTPARPTKSYQYPAVHDMPPPRVTSPLSDDEQLKVGQELEAARDSLESKAEPDEKPAPAAKTKPGVRKDKQTSGAKTNP